MITSVLLEWRSLIIIIDIINTLEFASCEVSCLYTLTLYKYGLVILLMIQLTENFYGLLVNLEVKAYTSDNRVYHCVYMLMLK